MGGPNKKEAIAALHRQTILDAAEQVFYEKGFYATTIEDLSKASSYSRRTIYTYFENKEDILYNIVLKGLTSLNQDLTDVLNIEGDFLTKYYAICKAITTYYQTYPYSFDSVNTMKNSDINLSEIPPTLMQIFASGTETNQLLENFLKQGQEDGIIQKNVNPQQAVYILWANLSSLITLTHNKGEFISSELNITVEQFLQNGFTQIINSILEVRL